MKPQVVVEHFPSQPDYTLSEFFINEVKRGVGVEDEPRTEKVKGETRIDNGIYPLDMRYSPKFSKCFYRDDKGYLNPTQTKRFTTPHELIWVKETPRHEYVLWHWGNSESDSSGCYIVGSYFGNVETKKGIQRGVLASKMKYLEIYPMLFQMITLNKQKGIGTFIEYKDKAA